MKVKSKYWKDIFKEDSDNLTSDKINEFYQSTLTCPLQFNQMVNKKKPDFIVLYNYSHYLVNDIIYNNFLTGLKTIEDYYNIPIDDYLNWMFFAKYKPDDRSVWLGKNKYYSIEETGQDFVIYEYRGEVIMNTYNDSVYRLTINSYNTDDHHLHMIWKSNLYYLTDIGITMFKYDRKQLKILKPHKSLFIIPSNLLHNGENNIIVTSIMLPARPIVYILKESELPRSGDIYWKYRYKYAGYRGKDIVTFGQWYSYSIASYDDLFTIEMGKYAGIITNDNGMPLSSDSDSEIKSYLPYSSYLMI